ncbi:hypothetical protein [Archangium sp.]|uniref:hypothetical protein n=1 Tax=Archangium sp. TaxID=1872627 RepID=UPI002ED8A631
MAATLNAGPVDVKTAPVFNPAVCSKKRVDACGCHHVYGVRHCHPKRKSEHCEAMVQANEPAEKNASSAEQLFSTEPRDASSEEQTESAAL